MAPTRARVPGIAPLASLLAAALLAAGCVSAPRLEASKDTVARMRRVVILTPRPPPLVINNMGVAMGFGVIGGLAQAQINLNNTKAFAAAVAEQKLNLTQPLVDALSQALARDGYQVSVDARQWPVKSADGKSDDFSAIKVDGDAILIAWFTIDGYMSDANSIHYEPWVGISVEMVDAATKQELYRKLIGVGWKMKIGNSVHLDADPTYRFRNYDAILSQAGKAVAGLNDCARRAADQVGADLAR
ncbi:MAG TPA: hypothetical protein VGG34_06285 [Opitutaceae bacterium]|jgi:hypothetical protein